MTEEKINKIAKIAISAINCGLSQQSTIAMVRHTLTNPETYNDAQFVNENLDVVVNTVNALFSILQKIKIS